MKRILFASLATVSGLVLLFGYKTSTQSVEAVVPTTEISTSADSTNIDEEAGGNDGGVTEEDGVDASSRADRGTSAAEPSEQDSAETTESTLTATSDLADGSYIGEAVMTRYGPVQVQVTISEGMIASVTTIDYPNSDRHDQQINSRAVPRLESATLEAQSSDIDMVSGATYTSEGYVGSLQSALDQARS